MVEIQHDLNNNCSGSIEAIQVLLRKENLPDAYNLVRDYTRTKL